MNQYLYVKNNPVIFIDSFGLFYFAKRRLRGFPVAINNDVLDSNNAEVSHEHGFFEDGQQPSNVGFGPTGLFYDEDADGYIRTDDTTYDDAIMRRALNIVMTGNYSLLGLDWKAKNNCQDFAMRLRDIYNTLLMIATHSG